MWTSSNFNVGSTKCGRAELQGRVFCDCKVKSLPNGCMCFCQGTQSCTVVPVVPVKRIVQEQHANCDMHVLDGHMHVLDGQVQYQQCCACRQSLESESCILSHHGAIYQTYLRRMHVGMQRRQPKWPVQSTMKPGLSASWQSRRQPSTSSWKQSTQPSNSACTMLMHNLPP